MVGRHPMLSPGRVRQGTPGTVARRYRAVRDPEAVYGNEISLDVDDVTGKSASDLAYRLGVSGARTGPQIPSAQALLCDIERQARSNQFAAPHLARDNPIDAGRRGTIRVGNQQPERIADCDENHEDNRESGEKSERLASSL
ncbi:MAG TPA: hypothetical protein VMM16_06640 [Verrucomicrobiae bacterium]|nr:hypothetical protein [Verrucomicrobiae bacterium]